MDLAKSLRVAMALKNVRPAGVAEALGIASPHVYMWLKTGSMTQKNMIRLAHYFEMKMSDFIKLGEEN